jgi:hypothetical protein
MDHHFLTLEIRGGPLWTIQPLKATWYEALSNLCFKFNLRRYTAERVSYSTCSVHALVGSGGINTLFAQISFVTLPKFSPLCSNHAQLCPIVPTNCLKFLPLCRNCRFACYAESDAGIFCPALRAGERAGGEGGRGSHSFTLELNLSQSRRHS